MRNRKQVPGLDFVQLAARVIRTFLTHQLNDHGLYAGQDKVIMSLAYEDGLSPGVLAKMLDVKPPTITKTISRLQDQGFVTKSCSDKDQRQAHIYLTENGRNAVEMIKIAILETEKKALKDFNQAECDTLYGLLDRVRVNLNTELGTNNDQYNDYHRNHLN